MLGTTAGGLYWMFRYLERSENTSRLLEAGLRMALTRGSTSAADWESLLKTVGGRNHYFERYETLEETDLIDFVLRDTTNPASVCSVVSAGRNSARLVRAALTRELWEATNQCWLTVNDLLAKPVREAELPKVLNVIRQESALVRGSLHGTMMRNDSYNFCRLGTFIERADSTARILDARYHVLLPTAFYAGSVLDNVQWETILRSVSAERAYRWAYPGEAAPGHIAEFLILDPRMPRSLAFCYQEICKNFRYLAEDYEFVPPSHELAHELESTCLHRSITSIFDEGLHQYLGGAIAGTAALGSQIEIDYRFNA